MKKSNIVFLIIVGILIFYTSNRCGDIYFTSTAENFTDKLNEVMENYSVMFSMPYLALYKNALLCGVGGVFSYFLAVIYFIFGRKNYLQGIEHGSAKWGTPTDIVKYRDKKSQQNMLLTQTESMSINTRQTMRNNNILVIGGSGSGKTRFFLKPNLMQLHSSYVITDPKGTVLNEVGKLFAEAGHVIKNFKEALINCYEIGLSIDFPR